MIVPNQQRKNRRILWLAASVVVGMFGFGYALVPLYSVLCKALNVNINTNVRSLENTSWMDTSRTIVVQFLANTNANLQWEFKPLTTSFNIHPGETKKITYFARNNADRAITIQAIPSIAPGIAANYLKKTQCFCFERQTLKAHESAYMDVLFHIDNELPNSVHTITLSYTLFAVKDNNKGLVANRAVPLEIK